MQHALTKAFIKPSYDHKLHQSAELSARAKIYRLPCAHKDDHHLWRLVEQFRNEMQFHGSYFDKKGLAWIAILLKVI